MKKWLALVLMAALLCAPAMAEEAQENSLTPYEIPRDLAVDIDLDGDGALDTVTWTITQPDEYTEDFLLTVTPAEGEAVTYAPECPLYVLGVYAVDLDGDGATELFFSGDEASDDYVTLCLRLFNGRLEPRLFADANRSDYNGGYYKYGYGMITDIGENRVTLCGSQDVLGTWFAQRTYALADTGLFEFADDGEWVRDMEGVDLADPELWANDYPSLTVTRSLPYTAEDGSAAELEEGAQLLITASDKQSYARFVTKDGVTGTLDIYPDYERGWGMMVNGESEDSWFKMIPYAD